HGVHGEPTPSDIVAAAQRFASLYGGTPNANDCFGIAGAVAAAAGATLNDALSNNDNPALNEDAGFWRVAYRGSDPNPVSNWHTLVQPGDIVHMAWSAGGTHTATVLSVNADGSLTVFDNMVTNGLGQPAIGIHA